MAERSPLPFDLNDALLDILRRVQDLMPFESGGLALYDAATQVLLPHAYVGDSALIVTSTPLGDGIVGQVAQTLQPIRIPDMQRDARARFVDPLSRSQLAVPIAVGNELLGVLNVESHQPEAYTNQHQTMLQALADQAALALQITRQYQGLVASYEELVDDRYERLREAGALQRLATITSATLDMDDMLTRALRETADLLDCEGAQLLLPDYLNYHLVPHETSLYGLAESWPSNPLSLDGPGYLVDVFHTGKPQIVNELPEGIGPGARNALACPLNTRQRTLGVLHLLNQRGGPFNTGQQEIAQAIANQIAVSMSSAQMFAAERHRAHLMSQVNRISQELYATLDTQTLLRKTAQNIYDVFGHDAIYVMLLDQARETIWVSAGVTSSPKLEMSQQASFPANQGIVGRAIREGQTQLVPDLRLDPDYPPQGRHHFLQSCLVIPLRRGDEPVGALDILSSKLNAFSDLERDALETLAIQVSIALENARLYDETRRRLQQQQIVYQIGRDLSAILDSTELAQAMAQRMNQALNTSNCLVWLHETQHNILHVAAENRIGQHMAGLPLLAGKYFPLDSRPALLAAAETRQPVVTYVDGASAPPETIKLLTKLRAQAQLIVPMVAGERLVGFVDWIDHLPGRRFSPDDIQLAQTLVIQATIAIENALLFRQLEQRALELGEANRLKNQFLATISHELRTPMNSIIGFSQVLLNRLYGDLNEEQSSRLERILRNGNNLLALIDDLLDLSKIDAGRMTLELQSVPIREAVDAVAQNLEAQAAAQGLEMTIDVPDSLPPVLADRQRLQQILNNLLSNAIKFTHEGGITITSHLTVQDSRPMIQVTVADTGIGINAGDLAIIFDEFRQADGSVTRAYSGTGLGLAITKKLVTMMNGTIWVESEPKRGSKFSFTLPVAPTNGR